MIRKSRPSIKPPIGTVYAAICRTTAEANFSIAAEAERDGAIIGEIELVYDDTETFLIGGMARVTGYVRKQ